jgi:hypothetical protein
MSLMSKALWLSMMVLFVDDEVNLQQLTVACLFCSPSERELPSPAEIGTS